LRPVPRILGPPLTRGAGNLAAAGAIRYARGKIELLNRQVLERESWDCYHIVKRDHERVLR
jgi:hypothetical protein